MTDKPWQIHLRPDEVMQLRALSVRGLTWAGDLSSKRARDLLREKGLVEEPYPGHFAPTPAGEKWLRCAEIGVIRD